MVDRSVPASFVSFVAAVVLVASSAPASAGPVGKGMLTSEDVGLAVVSKPHNSTVIAYDLVDPGSCAAGEDVEHEARVVSFGKKGGGGGPALNQVVYDFGSKAEAAGFFAELHSSDQARADCGSTEKATDLSIAKGPKGLGDDRYVMTSKELIAGTSRSVRSVTILEGSSVTELIFLDWASGKATAKVAKKAAARLG